MDWTKRRVDTNRSNALDGGKEYARVARDGLYERLFGVDIHGSEEIGEVIYFLGKFHDGGDDVFGRSTGDGDEFGRFPWRWRRWRKRRRDDIPVVDESIVRREPRRPSKIVVISRRLTDGLFRVC